MYSDDLRVRVVAHAKQAGPDDAAQVFNVGRMTVYRWLKEINPKVRAKRTPHKLADAEILRAHQARPDATLAELARPFGVSTTAVFKALQRLNVSRKKNVELHGKV
jgi:transposase